MEDLTHWPLVVGVYRDEATLESYQAQLDRWQGWFARAQPFALLRVYATPESLAHPEGSAAVGKAWLVQNRPLLARWVLGMATVILPPQDYARLRNMQVEKAFGVPGGVFASVEEAMAWLRRDVFGPAGMPVTVQAGDVMA